MAWAESHLHTKWHLDPYSRLTTTDMERKLGWTVPHLGWKSGSHLTQYSWDRSLPLTPSFILIHPIIWPQFTRTFQTGQDRTDNGPMAQGEPFYKRSPKNRCFENVALKLQHIESKFKTLE